MISKVLKRSQKNRPKIFMKRSKEEILKQIKFLENKSATLTLELKETLNEDDSHKVKAVKVLNCRYPGEQLTLGTYT